MAGMPLDALNAPLRLSLTATVLIFLWCTRRALTAQGGPDVSRPVTATLFGLFVPAALVAHTPLVALAPRLFPVGMAAGLGFAGASLLHGPTRRAFAAMGDGDARLLLGFRATFGALLFAAAGLGLLPPAFALSAGLGDMAVGWAAVAAPGSIGRGGGRAARLLLHGLGVADMATVLVLAATVVRPWSAAHGDVTTTMTLPWVGVPLMLAINLHGLWQALCEPAEGRRGGEAGGAPIAVGNRS